ncbi:unnamed protein product [Bursaphelenchus xylophilus]|uniref:(pine wood nematode) hypothetical protein n=1 Tax=Bursaphelenchus xylophilus TaxID=6326 RepID=A0A1I7RLM1_BURXY|nr:unnamed protein product [Bursaphelenchus xylophilus]CAG9082833.1 unnamed protein product [Bursaphelenchus xylophilus]
MSRLFFLVVLSIVTVFAAIDDIPIKYLNEKQLAHISKLALQELNDRRLDYHTLVSPLRGIALKGRQNEYRVDLVVAPCEKDYNCEKDQLENATVMGIVYKKVYHPEEFLHVELVSGDGDNLQ